MTNFGLSVNRLIFMIYEMGNDFFAAVMKIAMEAITEV